MNRRSFLRLLSGIVVGATGVFNLPLPKTLKTPEELGFIPTDYIGECNFHQFEDHKPNPVWANAEYEISYFYAPEAFQGLTPDGKPYHLEAVPKIIQL